MLFPRIIYKVETPCTQPFHVFFPLDAIEEAYNNKDPPPLALYQKKKKVKNKNKNSSNSEFGDPLRREKFNITYHIYISMYDRACLHRDRTDD